MFTVLVWCVCGWNSADVYRACVVCMWLGQCRCLPCLCGVYVVGIVQMFTVLVWCVCGWDSADVYRACVVCMWLE